MSHLEQKINSFYNNTMKALWHYYKHDDIETAFHCFRYSSEAFMKAAIYKIYGENDGHDIILGKKNAARQCIQSIGYNLSFSDLHDILKKTKSFEDDIIDGLYTINNAANKYGGSHDLNNPIDFEQQKENLKKFF